MRAYSVLLDWAMLNEDIWHGWYWSDGTDRDYSWAKPSFRLGLFENLYCKEAGA